MLYHNGLVNRMLLIHNLAEFFIIIIIFLPLGFLLFPVLFKIKSNNVLFNPFCGKKLGNSWAEKSVLSDFESATSYLRSKYYNHCAIITFIVKLAFLDIANNWTVRKYF